MGWFRSLARRVRPTRLQFTGPIPVIVLVAGLAAVVAIVWIGVGTLKQQSDGESALRSRLLARSLAERLATVHRHHRSLVIERAAIRSGAELLLVDRRGRIVSDGTVQPPSAVGIVQLLEVKEGETQTSLGRARFSTAALPAPLDNLSVLVFVPAPEQPVVTEPLIRLVAMFSLALLGVAALVAYALAKDAQSDITYVRHRIDAMAKSTDPAGTKIPVRSLDQVGALTQSFNELVQRFEQAEARYRSDLRLAMNLERDKSSFLAALSHELKTPLNVILGFTDVLLAEVEGALSEEAKENLGMVRHSGNTLKALIKDILDLSAIESGELALHPTETDVYAIADDVCREHRVSALEKGLVLQLTGRRAPAWADPLRVRQIIGNLLGNAIKFTSHGSVTIRVEPRGEQTAILVDDTGPGIAPREQATIFEDYAQLGDSAARGAGAGLGLAITRRLVRMHRGEISLTSELGRGAKFTVLLPRSQQEPAETESPRSDSSPPRVAEGRA